MADREECQIPKRGAGSRKRLKVIGRHGTGVDNIAVKEAELLGIQVVNGPTANINAVAEYTVGLILALSCGLVQADRKTRAKDWTYRLWILIPPAPALYRHWI